MYDLRSTDPILEAWLAQRCRSCSYDLRGSIPAGATHCPECGTPILRPRGVHAESPAPASPDPPQEKSP